jgi:hypothetical protein
MTILTDCIKEAEADSNYLWLARQLAPEDDAEFGKGYLVHIYRDLPNGDVEGYLASGSTLEHAFRGALARKKKGEIYEDPRA